MRKKSTAVLTNLTILGAAAKIMRQARKPIGPSEIAERGKKSKLFKIPRGRTRGYLSQLVQSVLYNDAYYRRSPTVTRSSIGKYRVRKKRKN